MSGTITKVSGPLMVAEGLADANVSDVVRVGASGLIGEILNMTGDQASIQVYEETSGLGPGDKVITTGLPLSVELGPGMLDNIYDGIQRPLPEMRALTGDSITRGANVPALNRNKKWDFTATASVGAHLAAGDELVNPEHSRMLARKLEALHIPCRLEIGPDGGHGFADGSGMCMAGWTKRAVDWYESLQT